ncbi:uncharacterized protein ACN427_013239 isoform 1-T1 [Glossina fuscipes fuscipes]
MLSSNSRKQFRCKIANINKSSPDRTTLDFYQKKSELTSLWQAFNKTGKTIRSDPMLLMDHPYILRNLHKTVEAMYNIALKKYVRALKQWKLSSCFKYIYRPQCAQRQKLCINCFKSDDCSKTCISGSYEKCTKKHNTLLHLEFAVSSVVANFVAG